MLAIDVIHLAGPDGENIHLMNATGFALHVHPPAYLRNRSNSPGTEINKASNPGAIEQPKRSSQTFGAVSGPLNQPPGPQLRGFQNLSGFAIGGDAIPVVLHGRHLHPAPGIRLVMVMETAGMA